MLYTHSDGINRRLLARKRLPLVLFFDHHYTADCVQCTGGEREMGGRNKKKKMMMEGATEGLSVLYTRHSLKNTRLDGHNSHESRDKKEKKKNQNELIFLFLSV